MRPKKFPKIFVYAVCWNEEKLLPYFFRHYSKFASKITIYDNQSTDRSREIILSQPNTELREVDSENEYRESVLTGIRNTCWKEAKRLNVDFVIVVDIDEFVVFPDVARDFSALKSLGVTVLRPAGFEMVSERFPKTRGQIYKEVRRGIPSKMYCKPCVFDPNKIDEISFTYGSHSYFPEGDVREFFSDRIRLFHCKAIGRSYFLHRNKLYKSRYGSSNQRKLGFQYLYSERKQIDFFLELKRNAKIVV